MNCDFQEISETLKSAKLYLENLKSLKTEICSVEKQVETTFKETQQNITKTFSNLKQYLCKILDNRELELLEKADRIRRDGLHPLKQCEKIIEKNIENTVALIHEGSQVSPKDQEKVIIFLDKAGTLGSLPEVPESKEVPYISFYHEPTTEIDMEHLCSCFGEVFRTAPIQIKSVTPKPGAILIEWQQSYEYGDDRIKDIQEFKLQRAFGDVIKEKNLGMNFIDCYIGADSQYLLRDIQIAQPYSFRVCCKFDGTTEWSPWSVPHVGLTGIRWFSWKPFDGLVLSNDDKIVTLNEGNSKKGRIIFSDGPQISLTDSVEFTVLETDPKSEIFVALTTAEIQGLTDLRDISESAFMVGSGGKISIAGLEKSTVLASFARGLKICFSMEPVNSNKVRVHVDCKEKRVTYDWSIGGSSRLFFACQLMPKWKIMVE